MNATFWKTLAIRALITGAIVGLGAVIPVLSAGTFPQVAQLEAASAAALGAAASVIVSLLSTLFPGAPGNFTA